MITSLVRVPLKLDRMPHAYHQTEADLAEVVGDDVDVEDRPQLVEGSDSSLEGFQIEEEDTVFVGARSADVGMVDEIVYNAVYGELVLHHSVDLPYLPLGLAVTSFGPGAKQPGGVHCVVGGFAPEIEVHDLNEMDEVRPEGVLAAPLWLKAPKKGGKAEEEPITSPEAHKGAVLAVAWSPAHPNVVLTGGEDGALKFWELSAMRCVQTLAGAHAGPVGQLTFIDRPQAFLSAGAEDGVLKFYDFVQDVEKPIWELRLGSAAESLQVAGHGRCVVGTSDGRVLVVVFGDGKRGEAPKIAAEIAAFDRKDPVTALAVSSCAGVEGDAAGVDVGKINQQNTNQRSPASVLVVCGSPEVAKVRVLELNSANSLAAAGERALDGGAFSLAFGAGPSACVALAGLNQNQVRALNVAKIVGPEIAERVFGCAFADMERLAELSLDLEGPADAAQADADYEGEDDEGDE